MSVLRKLFIVVLLFFCFVNSKPVFASVSDQNLFKSLKQTISRESGGATRSFLRLADINYKTGCSAFDNDPTGMNDDCVLILSAALSASAKDPILKAAYSKMSYKILPLYENKINDPFAKGRIKENYEDLIKHYTKIVNSGATLRLPEMNYIEYAGQLEIDNEEDFSVPFKHFLKANYFTKIGKLVLKRPSIQVYTSSGKIITTDSNGYKWEKRLGNYQYLDFISKGKTYNPKFESLLFIDMPLETAKRVYNTLQKELVEYNRVNYSEKQQSRQPVKGLRRLFYVTTYHIKGFDCKIDTHGDPLELITHIKSDIDFSIILADVKLDNILFAIDYFNEKIIFSYNDVK